MYEPSLRVPMLVRYPARVKPGQVDSMHMVLDIDVAPTILDLAGVGAPTWMHGRSWVPLLEGRPTSWCDAILYEYYEYPAVHCARKNRGVRTDRWKLIRFWEQPEEFELYDLKNGPDETTNLASRPQYANQVRELKAKMAQLRHEVGDVDPPGPAPVAAPCTSGIGRYSLRIGLHSNLTPKEYSVQARANVPCVLTWVTVLAEGLRAQSRECPEAR